jgi:hypothetical protein
MVHGAMKNVAQLIGSGIRPDIQPNLGFGRGRLCDEVEEQFFGFRVRPIG